MIVIATLTIIIQIIINVFSYMIIHIIVKPIIKMIINMLSIFFTKCQNLLCSMVDLFHIQWYYIIVERKERTVFLLGVPFFFYLPWLASLLQFLQFVRIHHVKPLTSSISNGII